MRARWGRAIVRVMPRVPRARTPGTPTPPAPFTPGPDKRRGNGPKKGALNAGRPPDWFKAKMRELGSRADVLAKVEEVLLDKNHPAYAKVLTSVWDRGYDKAAQPIDIDLTTLTDEQLAAVAAGKAPPGLAA